MEIDTPRNRIREKTSGFEKGEYVVYVLKIKRCEDEEMFYYVGLTSNLDHRILNHFSCKIITIPSKDGKIIRKDDNYREVETNYEIISLEEMEKVPDRKRGLEVERRKRYEIAIEENTTNVLG